MKELLEIFIIFIYMIIIGILFVLGIFTFIFGLQGFILRECNWYWPIIGIIAAFIGVYIFWKHENFTNLFL